MQPQHLAATTEACEIAYALTHALISTKSKPSVLQQMQGAALASAHSPVSDVVRTRSAPKASKGPSAQSRH